MNYHGPEAVSLKIVWR